MVLDSITYVKQFVDTFIDVCVLVIFLYIILSWVRVVPYSLAPVRRFIYDVCDPYLRLWRRLLPFSFGPLDLTPIVAILALYALEKILDALLDRLH